MQDSYCDLELVVEEFKPVQRILSFPNVRKWLFHRVPEEGFIVEGFRKSCVAVEMHPPKLETVKTEQNGSNLQLFSSSRGENCLKLLVPSHFEDGFLFNFVFGELYLVSPSNYLRREFEPFCKRSVYDVESGEVLESIWYQNGIVVLNYARFLTLCQQFYHAFIFSANYEERTPGKFLESTKLILERSVCAFCGLPGSHCRCHKRFCDLVTRNSFLSSYSNGGKLSLDIPFEILQSIHFGTFKCRLRHYAEKQLIPSHGMSFNQFSCPQLEISISSEMLVKEMPKSTFAFLSHRMIQLLIASLGTFKLSPNTRNVPTNNLKQHSSSDEQPSNIFEESICSEAAKNRRYRRQILSSRRQKKNNDTAFSLCLEDNSSHPSAVSQQAPEEKKLRKMIRNREYARESYNRRKVRCVELSRVCYMFCVLMMEN